MEPESAFVIALARGDLDGAGQVWSRGVDPFRVRALAHRHEVDALCSWVWEQHMQATRSQRPFELPQQLRAELREVYLHNRLRNESLENDLVAVSGALAVQGAESMVFKGPSMAFRAWPDSGARPVGDIDLCVREGDYVAVVDAIRGLGYRPIDPLPEGPGRALRQAHYRRQIRFSAAGRRPLELHFRMICVGPPTSEEDWVWRTARPLTLRSCTLMTPGPEAMLLHVLLHANQHGFASLRLLHDVRFALDADARTFDTSLFLERVERLRCAASAFHGLVLARDLAGADVPESLLRSLQPSRSRRMVFSKFWGLPAVRRLEPRPGRKQWESPRLYILEMGTIGDKLRFAVGLLGGTRGWRGSSAKHAPLNRSEHR